MKKVARLLLAALVTAVASAAVRVDKLNYKGWPNSYRVSNGEVELVVTGDVGPRIMRFGFAGGQNLLKEFPEQLGKSGEAKFQLRGGHRVWKAPEDPVATWAPDNVAVEVTLTPSGLVAREPVEPLTGLQKEIGVEMAASGTGVTLTHRIFNRGLFPLEFAAWALTMMAQGGVAITGFPPRGRHPEMLEATNPLVMWAYTDLSDRRWIFTKKYLLLRQDPKNAEPQKLGLYHPATWAGYLLNGELFLKRFRPGPAASHPDFGCSFETFTNADFLEIETLGPLTKTPPGGSVTHVEQWSLHKGIRVAEYSDAELDRVMLPLTR
ncbi:MAG: hypothetical protein SFV51_07275 [Bryobacteraceae bacterium]|nr:hypothetical protein [Bryobacteraceae bacterium]